MRLKNWVLVCCIICAVTSLVVAPVSADLVLNGGFELGTGTDADNWTEIVAGPAGTVERDDSMPRTGGFSAHLAYDHINNPAAGGAYFIEQNSGANAINGTDNLSLSFWAKSETTDFTGANMFFQVLWLDQDGSNGGGVQGEILTSLTGIGLNTEYQEFGFDDFDVPDTADSFLLRFQASAGAVDGIANGLFVDDVSLTVKTIPEPGSLILLSFACSGLALRRRRS